MVVGLTGGIGSGKSTVAKLMEVMGCAIYNSDERAKEVYYNIEVKQQVIKLLGDDAYLNEHEIDKSFISSKVFSDTDLLHKLNSIIHPAVKTDFIHFANQLDANKIIIKESAILFETGIYKDLDQTILVTAPIDIKIKRVISRSSFTAEEVEKRIHAQWDDEKKSSMTNFIINNDGSKALIPQVLEIISKLKNAKT